MIGVTIDVVYTIVKYEATRNLAEKKLSVQSEELLQQEEELRQQQEEMITVQERTLELANIENEKIKSDLEKIKAEKKLSNIESGLKYAAQLQKNSLPTNHKMADFFSEFNIFYHPKQEVSGDMYFINDYGDISLVAVIDGSGHGLAAGLMAMSVISYLNSLIIVPKEPGDLLENIHEHITESYNQSRDNRFSNAEGCDISILYILKNNKIKYSGAKGKGCVIRFDGIVELPSTNRSVGGSLRINKIFNNYEKDLFPDDIIVLFTDGFVDQEVKSGGKVGKVEFYELIEEFHNRYSKDWMQILNDYSDEHFTDNQRDDITVFSFNLS